MDKRDWHWRVEDPAASAGMRLLYEPGSWGDVLKGLWIAELAQALRADGAPLAYGDPFCGAMDYPLSEGAAERLRAVRHTPLYALQSRSLEAHRILGSAGLVFAGGRVDGRLFDVDPTRLASWDGRPGARRLAVDDGWQALVPAHLGDCTLVLVDPYDLDRPARWQPALEGLAALAAGGAVLVLYLFNRAPRGAARLGEYRRLRDALGDRLGPPRLIGRLPSDAVLPRAWHEVLLFDVDRVPSGCVDRLARRTAWLAARLGRRGAIERR